MRPPAVPPEDDLINLRADESMVRPELLRAPSNVRALLETIQKMRQEEVDGERQLLMRQNLQAAQLAAEQGDSFPPNIEFTPEEIASINNVHSSLLFG